MLHIETEHGKPFSRQEIDLVNVFDLHTNNYAQVLASDLGEGHLVAAPVAERRPPYDWDALRAAFREHSSRYRSAEATVLINPTESRTTHLTAALLRAGRDTDGAQFSNLDELLHDPSLINEEQVDAINDLIPDGKKDTTERWTKGYLLPKTENPNDYHPVILPTKKSRERLVQVSPEIGDLLESKYVNAAAFLQQFHRQPERIDAKLRPILSTVFGFAIDNDTVISPVTHITTYKGSPEPQKKISRPARFERADMSRILDDFRFDVTELFSRIHMHLANSVHVHKEHEFDGKHYQGALDASVAAAFRYMSNLFKADLYYWSYHAARSKEIDPNVIPLAKMIDRHFNEGSIKAHPRTDNKTKHTDREITDIVDAVKRGWRILPRTVTAEVAAQERKGVHTFLQENRHPIPNELKHSGKPNRRRQNHIKKAYGISPEALDPTNLSGEAVELSTVVWGRRWIHKRFELASKGTTDIDDPDFVSLRCMPIIKRLKDEGQIPESSPFYTLVDALPIGKKFSLKISPRPL